MPPPLGRRGIQQPFLRIPPFPGARVKHFDRAERQSWSCASLAAEVRQLRVGGSYWGSQPKLADGFVLAGSASVVDAARRISAGRQVLLWDDREGPGAISGETVSGECDPWHIVGKASALVAEQDDELRIIAALLECPCHDAEGSAGEVDVIDLLVDELTGSSFVNPFSGETMSAIEAIRLCGFWRELIDSNRALAGGLGFAFWKQNHVAPLLWGGSEPFKFMRSAAGVRSNATIAVWRSKLAPEVASDLECMKACLVEVEDGFLRSQGLGADCVPPLSITVDRLGAYFDPSQQSELETLLQHGEFDDALRLRAEELRGAIVDAGLSKYGADRSVLERREGERRHILVPGQVEDDRAVTAGGCGLTSNLELLKRVRDQAPDAFILYKPHPDVVAGHRRGAIPEAACLEYADEIVGDISISSLIELVDEVHVNTSLAGFEALLRKTPVTTYGVPFYAGWGLTRDLGPVPSRRTRARTLGELIVGVLLLYPRYLDPVTGLPCPAEVVVSRLTASGRGNSGLVVTMRRFQGKFMRRLRSLVQ